MNLCVGKTGSVSFATVTVLFCMNFRSDQSNSVPGIMKKILMVSSSSEVNAPLTHIKLNIDTYLSLTSFFNLFSL